MAGELKQILVGQLSSLKNDYQRFVNIVRDHPETAKGIEPSLQALRDAIKDLERRIELLPFP